MKNKKRINENNILATDFKQVDRDIKNWEEERNKRGDIYHAFGEYISFLESLLNSEDYKDFYERHLIEDRIKKYKKEREKYYVPSVLEVQRFDRIIEDNSRDVEKKSSFSLIKKIRKK